MLKKRTKKTSRYKYKESAIKPNVALAIDDIADYQNVIKKEQDLGYRGLQAAFINKSVVRLAVLNNVGDSEEITGIISHYDENYSQLVVIADNSLKRLTFDQIIDVLGGAIQNEELSN